MRLGVVTQWVTPELVEEVLTECRRRDRRPGALPAGPPGPRASLPDPAQDTHAALRWLHEHASDLGVDSDRIGVMGDSA